MDVVLEELVLEAFLVSYYASAHNLNCFVGAHNLECSVVASLLNAMVNRGYFYRDSCILNRLSNGYYLHQVYGGFPSNDGKNPF
jgi:hypothetical protein